MKARRLFRSLVERRRARTFPHPFAASSIADDSAVRCNICGWHGAAFGGAAHCESATCPRCGSIARDRFLFWCLQNRHRGTPTPRTGTGRLRVLETSPRLGDPYRRAMGRWFDYLCSDFDERAHSGMIRLDLQRLDLPDAGLDVILTPHVLEHVPDTDAALRELQRVLVPGGAMYLQVPLLQAVTAPPSQPEFHGDDTPVFWRFGPDLTTALERAGFAVTALVTEDLIAATQGQPARWPLPPSPEFDVENLLPALSSQQLTSVASSPQAATLGFEPAYMFLTWEAIRR